MKTELTPVTVSFEGLGRWDANAKDLGIDGIHITYWEPTDPVTTLRGIRVGTDLEMVQFLFGLWAGHNYRESPTA